MSKISKYIIGILLIVLVLVIGYKLLNIIIYIIIAAVLALLGNPIMDRLTKLGIRQKKMPRSIAALITMLLFFGLIASFFIIFVPPMVQKISYLGSLDMNEVSHSLQKPLVNIEHFLKSYNIIPADQNLEKILLDNVKKVFNLSKISSWINGIVGILGNLVAAVFSIAFILYFFLTDKNLLDGFIRKLVPENNLKNYENANNHIGDLLTKYFGGLLIQGSIFTILIFIGLKIIGASNPMLTALFGGLMNVIPYVGPIIGVIFGIFLEITSRIGEDFSSAVMPTCGWMILVFYVVQMIDNWIVQPYIFSTSLNAHPLEIFLVVLMAGTLGGILGMIIAIPMYSALRVIAKEFLSEFSVIKRLTQDIEYPESKDV